MSEIKNVGSTWMAVNNFKCSHLTPLHFKGLKCLVDSVMLYILAVCMCAYSDIQLLFLVGGFAESAMLQADIRQQFGKRLKIAIPHEASLAILKGISSRVRQFIVF